MLPVLADNRCRSGRAGAARDPQHHQAPVLGRFDYPEAACQRVHGDTTKLPEYLEREVGE
jgi:hypothetical protein